MIVLEGGPIYPVERKKRINIRDLTQATTTANKCPETKGNCKSQNSPHSLVKFVSRIYLVVTKNKLISFHLR